MATYKRLSIPPELKDRFVKEIQNRKGVYGGVILEATIEAIEYWIKHPEIQGSEKYV